MNLKTEAVTRRLRTLLEYHQKLQMENNDLFRMQEVANKIQQLTYILEKLNSSKLAQTILW